MEIGILENDILASIPLHNEDVRAGGDPEPVAVLKNAIDWASRPPDSTPLDGMPVAVMGATQGSFGTVRARMPLLSVLAYSSVLPVNEPLVLVGRAQRKFDAEGRLQDETTRKFVREQMETLVTWTRRVQADPARCAAELIGKDER
ncbi:MAG: NAD(P)H-dependent oxidoreductase [Anaerolineae bacterium]